MTTDLLAAADRLARADAARGCQATCEVYGLDWRKGAVHFAVRDAMQADHRRLSDAMRGLLDPAPPTAAVFAELGFTEAGAAFIRPLPDGRHLTVWPNTGGVELQDYRAEYPARLVEAGCSAGRLRGLVAALDPGAA